jgi:hypothetical protein
MGGVHASVAGEAVRTNLVMMVRAVVFGTMAGQAKPVSELELGLSIRSGDRGRCGNRGRSLDEGRCGDGHLLRCLHFNKQAQNLLLLLGKTDSLVQLRIRGHSDLVTVVVIVLQDHRSKGEPEQLRSLLTKRSIGGILQGNPAYLIAMRRLE